MPNKPQARGKGEDPRGRNVLCCVMGSCGFGLSPGNSRRDLGLSGLFFKSYSEIANNFLDYLCRNIFLVACIGGEQPIITDYVHQPGNTSRIDRNLANGIRREQIIARVPSSPQPKFNIATDLRGYKGKESALKCHSLFELS